jgi:ABC-type phosphate/phosphonate transport system substrate-binding protein
MMRKVTGLLVGILVSLAYTTATAGETISFAVMASEDQAEEGRRYAVLSRYIASQSDEIEKVELKVADDYPHAVRLFQSGEVDGMFAGSFVAAVFIKKGVARPLMRPLLKNGASTYRALIITRKGFAPFNDIEDLRGKTVTYCSLAAAGEVFARSLLAPGTKPEDYFTPVIARSHGAALKAVEDGRADYAIVKNLAWDEDRHLGLKAVGGDSAENPNMTLILNVKAYEQWGRKIRKILLRLEFNQSDDANLVRDSFGIRGFIDTSPSSFEHTFKILDEAGVDPATFDFTF